MISRADFDQDPVLSSWSNQRNRGIWHISPWQNSMKKGCFHLPQVPKSGINSSPIQLDYQPVKKKALLSVFEAACNGFPWSIGKQPKFFLLSRIALTSFNLARARD